MTDSNKDYPNYPLKEAKKFTSEYQPSPEAKSKGQKRYWQYRKARQQFFENLCDIKLPNGKTIDFWIELKNKLQALIFDKNSKLTDKEKSDLILKLCKEFMPEDKNIHIESDKPFIIKIDQVDKDL